ncbi:MAG: sigma-70 family RNA polymerase sigma factor [Gemmatimonadaceae bacterium]|nr:sigma-70 family RNA polymerase sigma factor [Gemmatimonadaceae bacterium]
MTAPTPDDLAVDVSLVARARVGDDEAYRQLVRRYEGMVAGVVRGIVRDAALADEVGQEAFVKCFASLDRFRGDASLRSYLLTIATRLALNAVRGRTRWFRRAVFLDDPDESVALDTGEDAARGVEQAETNAVVRAAVATLGADQRAVIVLRMFEGYSTREAAEALGVPEGTVLSRLKRAMDRLRVVLRDHAAEGG